MDTLIKGSRQRASAMAKVKSNGLMDMHMKVSTRMMSDTAKVR